ncbi:MAG TPA: LytR C-terminal domain-containing protein [Actinomycetes bacterium]|nr:LytR C-terminal domain-containing protein [Actinomycetes bacterium]
MSMYTPPGRGARSSRRRRSGVLRHAIVLVLALVLVVGAGVGAWWFTLRSQPAAPLPACPTPTVTVAAPISPAPVAEVKVNVYNATSRQGLAGRVSTALKERGIAVLKVANDPLKKTVPGTAEIRFGPAGESAAETVRLLIDGATLVVDKRTDATVDVVLGQGYTTLRTAEEAAAAATAAPTPPAGDATGGATAPTTAPTATATCVPVPPVTVTAPPPSAPAATPATTP